MAKQTTQAQEHNPIWDALNGRTIKAANFGENEIELLLDDGNVFHISIQFDNYGENASLDAEIIGPKTWQHKAE